MTFNDLMNVLKEIYSYHREMIELATRKKEILINGEIDELSKLIGLESSWVKKIGHLEEKRMSILHAFLQENRYEVKDITMSELTEVLTSSDEKNQLLAMNQKLQSAIDEIQNLNELNTQLIEQSLQYISNSVELITGDGGKQNYTYSKPSTQQASPYSSNNKGFFDKKA